MTPILIRRLISTLLATAISAAVLWWLLGDGTGQALLGAARTADFWPLALGGLIAIAIQGLRAWRFAILTGGGLGLPSWTMFVIATRLIVFNFLLPFKLGELSFPLMMKRAYDTPFSRGAGILVFCRLLDLCVVSGFILLTAAWLLEPVVHGWRPELVGSLGVLALLAPLVLADSAAWLQRLAPRWPRAERLISQVVFGASMTRPPRQRALVALLTFSIWLSHGAIAWLTAIAVGVCLGFLPMTMASAASNLAFALPISGVAGLGPPQAAWATMLHLDGVDWAPAIATALLCHGVLLITLSTLGMLTWIASPKRPGEAAKGRAPYRSD